MSKGMSGREIREAFMEYFAGKDHRKVRSSNLVPSADPTLLFTNAGMVPFKDTFLGKESRDYNRAVSCQKCLRVSGKHNDLEAVGRTNRHNTFFEMLGNFSFGDYFKENAIEYGWEFLTHTMKIPKEKLWVTVFEKDDEAGKLWPQLTGIQAERVIPLGEAENFWSMGAVGPCGPCSEIFVDHGEAIGCGKPACSPACDCGRYEEIWNLVFMQYNRDETGKLEPLPNPSIDTGMGLERLASVIQGVPSNFDTDLIRPVIARAEDVLGKGYGITAGDDISLRVIGDHIRTAAFLITEGILPSNDDRGYVLRRIMRRAMRHGNMLGAKEPFLYKVVGSVIDIFRESYPELTEAEGSMARIIEVEEKRFSRTLSAGLKILNDEIENVKADRSTEINGEKIFILQDRYGFPKDLAGDIAADASLSISWVDYDTALEKQRKLARSSSKIGKLELPEVYKSLENEKTEFLGYETLFADSQIVSIIVDGKSADKISKGESGEIVLTKTPFYGESGGQAGDKGSIASETGRAVVTDSQKPLPNLISHHVKVIEGEISKAQKVAAKVDAEKREATRRNHTATHLLQSALRMVLGEHVKQSGSAVGPDKLRFDFSHYTATTHEELLELERIVNEKVRENITVGTKEMDTESAMDGGATALFGEKYGAKVRVVNIPGFSKELCGGTHAGSTGEIGLLKILSETGVAAGIRRLEAVTGEGAFEYVQKQEAELKLIASLLKCGIETAPQKVEKLLSHSKELEKSVKKLKSEKARGGDRSSIEEEEVDGIKVIALKLDGADADTLRAVVDETKVKIGSGVVLAATADDGKVILIAGVTKDLTKKLHAGKIAKSAAVIVGGGGGGRPDMAQAGGSDPSKVGEALKSVFKSVKNQLGVNSG